MIVVSVFQLSAPPLSNYSNLTDEELLAFKKHNFEPKGFFDEKKLLQLKEWANWLKKVDPDHLTMPDKTFVVTPMNLVGSTKTVLNSYAAVVYATEQQKYKERAEKAAKDRILLEVRQKQQELTAEDIEVFRKHGYRLYGVFDPQTTLEIKDLAKKLRVTAPSKTDKEIIPIQNGTWKRIKAQGFNFDQQVLSSKKSTAPATNNNQRVRSEAKGFSVNRISGVSPALVPVRKTSRVSATGVHTVRNH